MSSRARSVGSKLCTPASDVASESTSDYPLLSAHCRLVVELPAPMTEEQDVFVTHIQKKGLKRTAQRDLILEVFLRTEGHMSGEDLYRLVQARDPSVGQTTVYRTLRLLTEAGLAREVRFGDGRAHYEHNYKHQHHDHMICSVCGKIIEFYSPELEAIQDAMAAKHRFELTEHLLRMIGVCYDCRKARLSSVRKAATSRVAAR